jgi:hypothetical protein
VGVKSLHVISCVQKVGFKRKKPRDHEKNKSKKYSVIKYKGLEEKMSLLVFFSEKVVGVFAFETIRSIVKFAPDGTGYRTKIIFAKEKLLIDRMSDILLRFFNID